MSEIMNHENTNVNSQEELQNGFDKIKAAYNKTPYPTYDQRKEVLLKLKKSIIKNEQLIYHALKKDYGYRSEFDSLIADVLPSIMTLNHTLKKLKKWMKPSKRHSGLMLFPSKVTVHYQPLGVVGVITPWNFPLFLSLGPAVQALAAGNRVMIKMSEFTPNTNLVLRKVIEDISDHIMIMEGEAEMGAAFSKLPFDHLIFTGSSTVGKHVAKAAADNLTPITLELGGKSPTIIGEDADMESAVDSVIIGKAINSAQICVSPDYIFVPESREQDFVKTFVQRYSEYYLNSPNNNRLTHIVTDRQFQRLRNFLDDAETKGAKIHTVKEYQESDKRQLYPHVLTNVNQDMLVMQEEIFGTILPVMTYKNIGEVLEYINARHRPLALYIMSTNKDLIDEILKNTHSGGVSINDTAMHVMADDAPFGGVGYSGIGHYHGFEGFQTFSKAKTVLHSKTWPPRSRYILQYRDLVFRALRFLFLR